MTGLPLKDSDGLLNGVNFEWEGPILGTITRCEVTDFGWRGVLPDGGIVEVRAWDPSLDKPKIPEHQVLRVRNGEPLSVYLIERKKRPARKRRGISKSETPSPRAANS